MVVAWAVWAVPCQREDYRRVQVDASRAGGRGGRQLGNTRCRARSGQSTLQGSTLSTTCVEAPVGGTRRRHRWASKFKLTTFNLHHHHPLRLIAYNHAHARAPSHALPWPQFSLPTLRPRPPNSKGSLPTKQFSSVAMEWWRKIGVLSNYGRYFREGNRFENKRWNLNMCAGDHPTP